MKHQKRDMKYILITPVKNEEKLLPNLIDSVINQTIRPILWIIVDDGSTDNTNKIITTAGKKFSWIQNLRLYEGIRDRGSHLANVIRNGLNYAYELSTKEGTDFEYIAVLDADVVLEGFYFEKLLEKFSNDPKLGIASGGLYLKDDINNSYLNLRYPDGGDMLIRKQCLEDSGGYPLTICCDTILNTKAKLRGWEVNRFEDSKAYIMRDYCHGGRLWNEYKKLGENYYFLNYNIFYACLKGFRLVFIKPYYIGIAYLIGYFRDFLFMKDKIDDREIREYFKYIRPKEINQHYITALKNRFYKE